MEASAFYDNLAADYDLVIDWPARLARESPLLTALAREVGARTALDVGGGTGRPASFLDSLGREVTIADPSRATLDAAREHLPPTVRTVEAGLGNLGGLGEYDLVLCLGNTIPHVATAEEFGQALEGLWARVAPGGALICHQLNYARILADFDRRRFLGPDGPEGRFFVRFFERDGERLRFVMLRVVGSAGNYDVSFFATYHLPVGPRDYEAVFSRLGVTGVRDLGGWGDEVYEASISDVLVTVARKPA